MQGSREEWLAVDHIDLYILGTHTFVFFPTHLFPFVVSGHAIRPQAQIAPAVTDFYSNHPHGGPSTPAKLSQASSQGAGDYFPDQDTLYCRKHDMEMKTLTVGTLD